MMADGCASAEDVVDEAAIDDEIMSVTSVATGSAGEKRNAHGGEITGRNEARIGYEFSRRIYLAFENLDFHRKLAGNARNHRRGGGVFHARNRTQPVENAIDAVGESLHVGGLPPIAADVENEHVTRLESGIDVAQFAEAAQQESRPEQKRNGERDLRSDERPLERMARRNLGTGLSG